MNAPVSMFPNIPLSCISAPWYALRKCVISSMPPVSGKAPKIESSEKPSDQDST